MDRNGGGAAKVQGFRKGDLVEYRWDDSLIYSAEVKSAPSSAIRIPALAAKGQKVTLSSGVLFPPGGKCHCTWFVRHWW